MVTVAELDRMEQINIKDVDKNTLVDIQTVKIDPLQSSLDRMENYLAQIKNPYCFLCDNSIVKVRFQPNAAELTTRLKNYFIGLKTE